MALGKKIRELREELGMSQAQLSGHGGLSQGYLSQLENDEVQNPSAAVIFRLAQALHIDPRVLMEAAGYHSLAAGPGDGYEVTVDPELLRFLARFPREQQGYLLKLLEGLNGKAPKAVTAAAGAPHALTQRRGRSRVAAG
jgi:transcriptional regulator with XRE-family HTH domain